MIDILFFIVMFPLTILSFLALGIAGAVAFEWVGDKAFDMIAAGQEWQQKKGWW